MGSLTQGLSTETTDRQVNVAHLLKCQPEGRAFITSLGACWLVGTISMLSLTLASMHLFFFFSFFPVLSIRSPSVLFHLAGVLFYPFFGGYHLHALSLSCSRVAISSRGELLCTSGALVLMAAIRGTFLYLLALEDKGTCNPGSCGIL